MQLDTSDFLNIERLVKKLQSQDKAAKAIGVSERTLGRYRNGVAAPVNKTSLAGFRAALKRALGRKQ
jgi:transcriptional regulator with XRE-family HTH domain